MRLRAAQKLVNSVFYIFFEQNSNELSPKAIEKLDRIYEILANNAAAKLTLNGYSDSIGSPSYNQMVSEIRALSVKSYLSGKGIKHSRMMAFGHGAQKFIANNKSAEGRRLNRRVEMELIIP
jgi:outer membrane protein OmpA-like peptidoglycan-associated protein